MKVTTKQTYCRKCGDYFISVSTSNRGQLFCPTCAPQQARIKNRDRQRRWRSRQTKWPSIFDPDYAPKMKALEKLR